MRRHTDSGYYLNLSLTQPSVNNSVSISGNAASATGTPPAFMQPQLVEPGFNQHTVLADATGFSLSFAKPHLDI